MLLAIDVGNTDTVFALYQQQQCQGLWRSQTSVCRTTDEYAAWLAQLFQLKGLNLGQVNDAVIGSVVPGATYHLVGLCQRYLSCYPLVVSARDAVPAPEVEYPKEVGVDRLVNAIGAAEVYPTPLVVVDFGTATTFDLVDVQRRYCGGVIAPGVWLALESLCRSSAQLPQIEITRPAQVVGLNTVECMQSGIFWGYVGLIEGILSRIKSEHGPLEHVVATGGLAEPFTQSCPNIDCWDEEITLRGLRLVYQRWQAGHD